MTKPDYGKAIRNNTDDVHRLRAARQFIDQAYKNMKLIDGSATDQVVWEVLGQVIEEKKESRLRTKRPRELVNEDGPSEISQTTDANSLSAENPLPTKKIRLASPERIATPEVFLPAPEAPYPIVFAAEEHSSHQLQFNNDDDDDDELPFMRLYPSFNETEAFPPDAATSEPPAAEDIFNESVWKEPMSWSETGMVDFDDKIVV